GFCLGWNYDEKFGHGFSHGSVTVWVTIQDLSQARLIALESSQSPCQFKGLSLLVLLNHSLGQSSKFAL
ncbi:MAG: hypothetical protein QNK38_07055, partial [Nitrospirota bacterium]|nr:hypothetical protein [Nitrospirota bacterium]MDX2420860.1 hypothetical protein [Nitrospirota bacterium]